MGGRMKLKPRQQYEQGDASKAQGKGTPLIPNAQSSKQCGHKRKEHIHALILAYAHAIKMAHCLGK
jgi:hypothetical protein